MLFALDLGNKQAKLKSAKLEIVLPSRFVIADKNEGANLLSYAIQKSTNKKYKSSKSDKVYEWGEDLKEGSTEKRIVDTMGFGTSRYKSNNFALLVDFGLAELAKDYAGSKKGFLEVDVETGIPTEDYFNMEARQALEDVIKGDHHVYIDESPVNIRVNNVNISPQPLGTIANEIIDYKGNLRENPLSTANIGVVDIGGGTFIADAYINLELQELRKVQLPKGAYKLYLNIKNALAKEKSLYPSEHEIEKILLIGSESGEYSYSPDGKQIIDITKIVMEERTDFTTEIIGEIISAYRGFGRMQLIFVTGGGANLLIKDMLEKELGIVYFVENSQTANVRGFYKQGLVTSKQAKGE